jgi:hypothetical protein
VSQFRAFLGSKTASILYQHAFRGTDADGYILRTGAENPDWEKLGGDYFVADWEKRGPKNSAMEEEAKARNVSE